MAESDHYVDIELGQKKDGSFQVGSDPGQPESATERSSAKFGGLSVRGAKRRETFHSIQSNISRLSRIASIPGLNFFRTLTQRPSPDPGPVLSGADIKARTEFFTILLHQDANVTPPSEDDAERLSAPPAIWYGRFLECRFRTAWTMVVREALKGLDPLYNEPQSDENGKVYTFMSVVASLMLQPGRESLSMVEITDAADCSDNLCLFKEQKDIDRSIPNQLVFMAVGWLTMLYDPEPPQRPGQFRIRRVIGSMNRRRTRTRPGRTFVHYVREGIDQFDQPLFNYLRSFGRLIPEAGEFASTTPLITVRSICFSILDGVGDVHIEWVNSLSQHLEFDNVRRVLKVFRFPSFCMLMYRDMTTLSNIYLGHSRHIQGLRADEQEDLTPEYFREILLSYRLIFGQEKASWKLFNKRLTTFGDHWNCSDRQSDDADPMLLTLCGASCTSPAAAAIYDDIAADGISPCYYPESDFPFLGRRILDLQAFVNGRSPHNWRGLWNDKRNVGHWWTFWAVIIIGGGTILLGLLAVAFQVWGSVSAQRQLDTTSPSCPSSCS